LKFNELNLVFYLKLFVAALLLIFFLYFLFNETSRKHLFSYFNTRCLDYNQKDFSRKLNDRIVDYSAEAKRNGILPFKDEAEFKKRVSAGKLVKVRSGNRYVIERMTYSYPYITKRGVILLDEIANRLREKTSKKGLKGVKIIVTSMTRKTESLKSLRRNNRNASANSPHIYGNAFDISYKRFVVRKRILTNCDKKYLKEALAEVIWELSEDKKCWATYERVQNCFHVVSR